MLYDALLIAAQTVEIELGERDEYGQRYTLDFEMSGPSGAAVVRSCWIVLGGEDFPRMVSCYVM